MSRRTPSRAVTIRDVAREAGVSTSTVSRVLDERLPPSQSEAAERVREVASRLGYRRDAYASALRRQQNSVIGVLVPRLTDTVMALLFEEIVTAAARTGVFAIVATTQDDPEREKAAVTDLLSRRVDGLILTTARLDDPFTVSLRERGVSVALALRTDGVNPAALGDDEYGGYLAARHLVDLGHRRIALVAGPDYASSALGRRRGFERAMGEAGLAVDPALVLPSSFSMESGEQAGRLLLALPEPPTAIFAVNDNTAIGVLAAARAAGRRVPDDLSVVGYNDIPISARMPVPLTTVRVPLDQVAVAAVDLLSRDDTDPPGHVVTVSPSLVPRQTTARTSSRR